MSVLRYRRFIRGHLLGVGIHLPSGGVDALALLINVRFNVVDCLLLLVNVLPVGGHLAGFLRNVDAALCDKLKLYIQLVAHRF
ncbi:hypothetical protein CZ787_06265 [Halomonas citrativorans]|uniref:Uncharacterized protein n=1 Tax=Halomonas citrativorans TaxID=2742612 RepID=A0A1R4HVK5_9GAMM|nr:hypothetical protein CZ787_06265 [Halomonas citrativorans]